jgi:hypothetical protein
VPLAGAWRLTFLISAGLAAIAGLMLFAGPGETDRFFSWTIEPPATAAFLGAAYWAVVLLFAGAAGATTWSAARVAAWSEATAAVLLLLATLLHLDKFHDDLYGYFWIGAYCMAAPALLVLVWTSERLAPQKPAGGPELPPALRALLAAHAVAFLAFGAALIVGPVDNASIWPWELTPLTARAIAAFLLGFAVAAALAVRESTLPALAVAARAYCALGALELLAAAVHSDDFHSGAGLAAFSLFFASVLAAGAWGLFATRQLPPRSSSRATSAS